PGAALPHAAPLRDGAPCGPSHRGAKALRTPAAGALACPAGWRAADDMRALRLPRLLTNPVIRPPPSRASGASALRRSSVYLRILGANRSQPHCDGEMFYYRKITRGTRWRVASAGFDRVLDFGHRIADTGARHDVTTRVRVLAELAAQPGHVDAQQMSLVLVPVAPDAEEDVLLGQGPADVLAQTGEEPIFRRRQENLSPVQSHEVLGVIDHERSVVQDGRMTLVRREARAPQHGAHAGEQLPP